MNEWSEWHEKHSDKIELIAGVDCWCWTGAEGGRGYGRVSYNKKAEYAHRAAYIESAGPIQAGLLVRHLCHNRFCVRPGHLAVGSHADNSMDSAKIFRCGGVLAESDVIAIRIAYKRGTPLGEIASRFGIAFGSVYPVVCGKSYAHVTSEPPVSAMRVKPRVDAAIYASAREMIASGKPNHEIAKRLSLAVSAISNIRTASRYQNFAKAYTAATQDKIERGNAT